jgi:hypothetical protein
VVVAYARLGFPSRKALKHTPDTGGGEGDCAVHTDDRLPPSSLLYHMRQEAAGAGAVMTRIHIRETTSGVVPNTPVNLVVADQQSSASAAASGSRDGAKSPSPARRAVALGCAVAETGEGGGETAKRPGVSDESGFYEEDEAMACASSLQAEDSVEIIFDKNASNNNLGADGRSPNTGTVLYLHLLSL